MSGISRGLLDRLDGLIERYALHARPCEPVDLGALMEEYHAGFHGLPDEVEAVAMRWSFGGERLVRVALHQDLRRLSASSRRRHAEGHEYGHIVCRHRGDMFVMWRERRVPTLFDRHIESCQERECELVAAYLLVPAAALWEMRHHDSEYIGRVLDVPAAVVECRYRLWGSYGR